MKLIFAIVSNDDSSKVQTGLTMAGFQVTRLSSTGGFLMAGNTTFICGTEDDKVDEFINIVKENSKPRSQTVAASGSFGVYPYAAYPLEVSVGGATIFVTGIDRFEKV